MQRGDFFEEHGFSTGDIFDGLARHRIGQEADEITGMSGLERDADFAVRLEAADARAMPGSRIDDDERPALGINLDALRRYHPGQNVVDRSLEGAAVEDQFDVIVQDVRRRLGKMFAILVAALPHDVEEQDAALRRVDHVVDGGIVRTEE